MQFSINIYTNNHETSTNRFDFDPQVIKHLLLILSIIDLL